MARWPAVVAPGSRRPAAVAVVAGFAPADPLPQGVTRQHDAQQPGRCDEAGDHPVRPALRRVATVRIHSSDTGISSFQPSAMNWS